MKTGIELIAAERERQTNIEHWTPEHDDSHDDFELGYAARCYEESPTERDLPGGDIDLKTATPNDWPWDDEWWKPTPDDRQRELVKAGALYRAEIERLERKVKQIASQIDRLQASR